MWLKPIAAGPTCIKTDFNKHYEARNPEMISEIWSLHFTEIIVFCLYLIKKWLLGKQLNPGLKGIYDDYCINKTDKAKNKTQNLDGHIFMNLEITILSINQCLRMVFLSQNKGKWGMECCI